MVGFWLFNNVLLWNVNINWFYGIRWKLVFWYYRLWIRVWSGKLWVREIRFLVIFRGKLDCLLKSFFKIGLIC